jgi:hypothetical protein
MGTPLDPASVIAHLGGEELLTRLGVCNFVSDDTHLSFTFVHENSKGVHSVTIETEPNGWFRMTCYGRIPPRSFRAPIIGTAEEIIPENLATVLGNLTGLDILHHRHF